MEPVCGKTDGVQIDGEDRKANMGEKARSTEPSERLVVPEAQAMTPVAH